MSLTKKVIIVIVVIIALFAVYYFYKKSQNVPLRFLDNGQAAGLSGDGASGGNVGFVLKDLFSETGYSIKVGDTVFVVQDSGARYPQYDGEAKVTDVFLSTAGNQVVIIDKGFAGNSAVNPGYITKTNVF